jgi:proteasome lid subunit RPN8/RPN11
LVGTVHDLPGDNAGFAVAISACVPSVAYDSTGVSLTMDTDVWERARLPAGEGRSVIGWYHSHPNLGAFFSGTDRRTQRAFFNQPHSLGLVVDPIRKEKKWFIGADSAELPPWRIIRHS